MRVLVCGGRMFGQVASDGREDRLEREESRAANERGMLRDTLNQLGQIDLLVLGGGDGADKVARQWAEANDVGLEALVDERSLAEHDLDLVVAFPGCSTGIVGRAETAGIRVHEIPRPRFVG